MKRVLSLSMLPLVGLTIAAVQPPAELTKRHESEVRPLIKQYCLGCHSGTKPSGGILLSPDDLTGIQKKPELWRTALTRTKERSMPPQGAPAPSLADREKLVAGLTAALDSVVIKPDPGHTVLRRLSRREYNNTVRDLFGVTITPADSFPADGGGGGGFDNNADTLFTPPVLLERYLLAAQEVLEAAPADRLFTIRPSAKVTARQAAQRLIEFHGSRAFRRPILPEETARFLRLYDSALLRKEPWERAVKLALKASLVSPSFLFRVELAPAKSGNVALTDMELASRLSYFLWNSMPDAELFSLARQGKLHQPSVLTAQVRRLLLDPKARSFFDDFSGQWLHTRDLYTTANPDRGRFPEYQPALRDAMYQESVLFFESVFRDNAPLPTLLNASYTFVNEPLAKHYGMEGITGSTLRRVSLSDQKRGGILTMASTLTISSYPQRTSPVLRGKWVMSEVLGTPPPPPPPVTKTLPPSDRKENGLTFRQRLEKHREDPACGGCHSRIDPMGFGLENYDPIGRWREKIGEDPVEATGTFPSGESYVGPAQWKALILARQDEFLRNLVEKMLAYALGRGLEPADQPAVKKIRAQLKAENQRAETLIREIVLSLPFQFKKGEGTAPPAAER